MWDNQILFVAGNGFVEDVRIVVLVRRRKMILVKFDRHPDSGSDDFPQQLHVSEHPFVADRSDPEISLEERVKSVKKELDGSQEVVWRRAESATPQKTERKAERDEDGVLSVIRNPVCWRHVDVRVVASATFSAVGDPLVIDVAEWLAGDAGRPEVEVFVDVHVEQRVKIDKVFVGVRLEGVANDGAVQPFVQFRRPDCVVDDALKLKVKNQ